MKVLRTVGIQINMIEAGERQRPVDPGVVEGLAQKINEHGFTTTIQVADVGEIKYRLVDGAHRLAACQMLGLEQIPAVVIEATATEVLYLEALAELTHLPPTALSRAVMIHVGKAAYEEMNPEAKRGKSGAAKRWGKALIFSFASSTAEKMDLGKSTVRRAALIGGKLAPDVIRTIATTPLAKDEGSLYRLAKEPHDRQRKVVDLVLGADGPDKVRDAIDLLEGKAVPVADPKEAGLRKLLEAWARANNPAKRSFLAHLRDAGIVESFDIDGAEDEDGEAE